MKEAVLPWNRFRTPEGKNVDTVLGPEMKSTGEVMGIAATFGVAYAKSQAAAYGELPTSGRVFVSVNNRDKRAMLFPVKRLADLGFTVLATEGTADVLRRNGVEVTVVGKHSQPDRGPARRGGDDPGRRGRPGHQHPVRGRAPPGRLRDPDRLGGHRHPVHHHRAGRRRRGAGHRRQAPRARSASGRCRSTTQVLWAARGLTPPDGRRVTTGAGA